MVRKIVSARTTITIITMNVSDEHIPILSGDSCYKERSNGFTNNLETHYSPEMIYSNFKAMSISFSLNQNKCTYNCIACTLNQRNARPAPT